MEKLLFVTMVVLFHSGAVWCEVSAIMLSLCGTNNFNYSRINYSCHAVMQYIAISKYSALKVLNYLKAL